MKSCFTELQILSNSMRNKRGQVLVATAMNLVVDQRLLRVFARSNEQNKTPLLARLARLVTFVDNFPSHTHKLSKPSS